MKKALIKVHIAVLLAGFTGPLGRLISLSAGVLVWYRLGISAITFIILMMAWKQFSLLPRKLTPRTMLTGLLVAIHWVLFYGSIKYANVSVALLCFSSTSIFTSLLEPLILKSRFDPQELLLSFIAIGGIYILFHFNSQYHTGVILGLLSAIFAATFTVLNKSLTALLPSKIVSMYVLIFGFTFLTLLMPLYLYWLPQKSLLPTTSDWMYLLFLSWFCTVLAFTLSISALKKVSSFTLNLSLNLEPVYGIILAFILFHENKLLNSSFYIGFILIIISVILQMLRIISLHRRQSGLPAA
jgi:drug/metabolite transporter (DMT)-like permease